MIQLPNNEKCYNLQEQVAQNLLNIRYLAEQYANIDSLPALWKAYKDQFDEDFDTFGDWTTTFEGWDTTLSTYLANMSSAAVGAIAGQTIAPATVNATTGNITTVNATTITGTTISGNSIVEIMSGYTFDPQAAQSNMTKEFVYCGACKNGNKLTLVIAMKVTRTGTIGNYINIGSFYLPAGILSKIYPVNIAGNDFVDLKDVLFFDSAGGTMPAVRIYSQKYSDRLGFACYESDFNSKLTLNSTYYFRYELTILLSDNLAS